MNIKDKLLILLSGLEANFYEKGFLVPVFITEIDGDIKVSAISWTTPQDKEDFVTSVKELIFQNKIKEYVLIAEAWFAMCDDEAQKHLDKEGTLENFSNKKEMALLNYSSAEEEIEYTSEIIRGKIGAATLSPWTINNRKPSLDALVSGARFQNLFLRAKADLN